MLEALYSQYDALRDQLAAIQIAMAPVRLTNCQLLRLFLKKAAHDLTLAFSNLSPPAQYTLLTIPTLLIAIILDEIRIDRKSLRHLGLPYIRPPKGAHRWDYTAILKYGRRRHRNKPFPMRYSGSECVVFPVSMWDEVKRIPQTKASARDFFRHVVFGGWDFLGTDVSSALHKSIGTDLTRAIPARTQARYESAGFAARGVALGECPDRKPFRMYAALRDVVSTTNAVGLVGDELGTDPRWRGAVQRFSMAVGFGSRASGWSPRILRPLVAWVVFLPAWALYWRMRFLLRPVVTRDVREYENAVKKQGVERTELMQAAHDKKFPMTAWLMARYRPEERTPAQVARDFIVASFESTASTSGMFYFIMAELVTRPELCDELREEIAQVMVDGKLPRTNLTELRKLDSVMRECSRWNPFGHMALFRRLRAPVKLSVGPKLPAGSVISVDIHSVPLSELIWTDPNVFDPMRFLKLRQRSGHKDRHQFTSLGADNPSLGDGPQACPGRDFAVNTLKVALAYILMNYHFRIPPGGESPKRYSMPNGSFRPDMTVKIEFRDRGGSKKTL